MNWLEQNLRSVDDPAIERRIHQQLVRHPRLRSLWMLDIAVGTAVSVAMSLALSRIMPPLYAILLTAVTVGFATGAILARLYRNRRRRVLEAMLAGMDRCPGCGYLRADATEAACPECGRAHEAGGLGRGA